MTSKVIKTHSNLLLKNMKNLLCILYKYIKQRG